MEGPNKAVDMYGEPGAGSPPVTADVAAPLRWR